MSFSRIKLWWKTCFYLDCTENSNGGFLSRNCLPPKPTSKPIDGTSTEGSVRPPGSLDFIYYHLQFLGIKSIHIIIWNQLETIKYKNDILWNHRYREIGRRAEIDFYKNMLRNNIVNLTDKSIFFFADNNSSYRWNPNGITVAGITGSAGSTSTQLN